MYENVKCTVRLNGVFSDSFVIKQGVKQGCKLSPTLFSIYMNDLATQLAALKKGVKFGGNCLSTLMYADDIVVIASSAADLQCQLNCVNEWCQKWRLDLNADKSKIMHFRPKKCPTTTATFKCGNLKLGQCSTYKYLGIWFTEHLDMSFAAREISKAASRALGAIIAKFKALGGISFECFKKLYESNVQPILLYGAGVWG